MYKHLQGKTGCKCWLSVAKHGKMATIKVNKNSAINVNKLLKVECGIGREYRFLGVAG